MEAGDSRLGSRDVTERHFVQKKKTHPMPLRTRTFDATREAERAGIFFFFFIVTDANKNRKALVQNPDDTRAVLSYFPFARPEHDLSAVNSCCNRRYFRRGCQLYYI